MALSIKLSPKGLLLMGLPDGRDIELADASAIEVLKHVLSAQSAEGRAKGLGTQASPTEMQVLHWQRHSIWKDARCAFCRADMLKQVNVQRIEAGISGFAKPRPTLVAAPDVNLEDLL